MKRKTFIDRFYDKQPPLGFVDELKKPYFQNKNSNFCRTKPRDVETCVQGIYLSNGFPDEKGLLSTVFEDFENFARCYGIGGDAYPVLIRYGKTECFEAYEVNVEKDKTTITAEDTEGVRRAIISIEDRIIAAEGPFLETGRTRKKPWLKSRITRGFFSPTNRPPKCVDELANDVDYYPDNYLNRLMHDGTNGLWIYTRFSDLLPSSVIEEYGKESAKRIEKLKKIIKKCADYGIKVYVFSIEPAAIDEKLYGKYPGLAGMKLDNQYCLCPYGKDSEKYLFESGKYLATSLPGLGGVICITTGERLTDCASVIPNECPNCKDKPRGRILAKSVELLRSGIRAVNPEIEFVSWTYGQREWKEEDIADYVRYAPSDVYLMQNFDDYGFEEQLGKERIAIDYWLSYIGPSYLFTLTGNEALKYGKKLWAKMQICCSHELASVPYVPSPLNVYEKLRSARKFGVTGIMECWYFGNYPCLMSKAVGEMAFSEDESADVFLKRLASVCYGESYAEQVFNAWNLFYEGYKNYPLNIMFSYYGPMHDGVVWELALKPKNYPLPRSWQLTDSCDGDRINESLMFGHTLDEAITLVGKMKDYIEKSDALLSGIKYGENSVLKDLISVSNAIKILFDSGFNILRFYKLRDSLGLFGDINILFEMKEIVKREIKNSQNMIQLCEEDARLGYHSEAEGYKFFPAKLKSRIEQLNALLDTEFEEVEKRIKDGLPPLEYYEGKEEGAIGYRLKRCKIEDAEWEYLSDGKARFRMAEDGENLVIMIESDEQTRFSVVPEWRILRPSPGIYVYSEDGRILMPEETSLCFSVYGERRRKEKDKWKVSFANESRTSVIISIKKEDIDLNGRKPFKLSVATYNNPWVRDGAAVKTLCREHMSPGEFGWIYPEQ